MKRVSLRQANQKLSACIAEAEKGEHIVVERRGVPVAKIIPFSEPVDRKARERELKKFFALLDKGIPLGGEKAPSKDEMHER